MSFQCTIVTPEQQLLDQAARQVILPAHDGQIGILTNRAPLLVKLGLGKLQIDLPDGKSQTYLVDGGVAQMKDNKLTVLTSAAWEPAAIDPAEARKEYDDALKAQPTDTRGMEEKQRKLNRAKLKQELATTTAR
jgi:F-type H+-transporting ATPase subunit epsilon